MSEMNITKHINLLHQHVRSVSNQVAKKPKNYYTSLGISAKATQSDIKAAYYKLSMIYHPDKNKDIAAEEKFRDISEAYETLSDVQTRKLYDRGIFMKNPNVPHEDFVENKFYKSRDVRSKPPAPQGRTAAYNYDEWSRAHYENSFHRDLYYKRKQETRRENERKKAEETRTETIVICLSTLILLCLIFGFKRELDSRYFTYDTKKPKSD